MQSSPGYVRCIDGNEPEFSSAKLNDQLFKQLSINCSCWPYQSPQGQCKETTWFPSSCLSIVRPFSLSLYADAASQSLSLWVSRPVSLTAGPLLLDIYSNKSWKDSYEYCGSLWSISKGHLAVVPSQSGRKWFETFSHFSVFIDLPIVVPVSVSLCSNFALLCLWLHFSFANSKQVKLYFLQGVVLTSATEHYLK